MEVKYIKQKGDVMTYAEFQVYVDWLFWFCVDLLKVWGDWTGLGYNLLNILIFILLQPLLILVFFILWRIELKRRKKLQRSFDGD